MKKWIALGLVALSFAQIAPAGGLSQLGTCDFMSADFETALPYILIIATISAAIAAIAYGAGRLTSSPYLLEFSKDHLFHLVVSIFLVACIQGIFSGVCYLTYDYIGDNPLTVSVGYMRGLHYEGKAMLSTMMRESVSNSFEAATVFGYYVPVWGGESFFYSFKNAWARHLDIVFDLVMAGYVSAGVQWRLLEAVRDFVLPVFVPIGLILRFIPFLRDSGNVVLALAFAVYIMFPLAYAINSLASDIVPVCDETEDAVFGACDGLTGMGSVAGYLFQTIFLPNLALVVLVTSAGAMVKVAKVIS